MLLTAPDPTPGKYGGRLSLGLANVATWARVSGEDLLDDPGEFAAWLGRASAATPEEVEALTAAAHRRPRGHRRGGRSPARAGRGPARGLRRAARERRPAARGPRRDRPARRRGAARRAPRGRRRDVRDRPSRAGQLARRGPARGGPLGRGGARIAHRSGAPQALPARGLPVRLRGRQPQPDAPLVRHPAVRQPGPGCATLRPRRATPANPPEAITVDAWNNLRSQAFA